MLRLHRINRVIYKFIVFIVVGLMIVCFNINTIDSSIVVEKSDKVFTTTNKKQLLRLPPNEGEPVRVSMGVYITNVAAIDEIKQIYDLSGYIIAKWQDKRLVFKPQQENNHKKYYTPDEVWIPDLEMINATTNFNKGNAELIADAKGNVRYTARFYATLSADMSLRKFPFDSQELKILIESFTYNTNQLNFVADNLMSGWDKDPYVSLPEWTIKEISSQIGVSKFSPTAEYYSRYIFRLRVQRKYLFYFYKILIPLIMMVIISWLVFWLDINDINNQITLSITTVLIATVFSVLVDDLLPKVSYIAYINVFFLICYLFIFLVVCEVIAISKLRKDNDLNIALKVRQISRWLFPTAFGIINLLLLIVFIFS